MKIRKLYRIESAHIVRNAISERCSHSYHGHSGVVEVFFKAKHLDNAGMVYDFGAMKNTIGSFIDMFDHAVHLWKNDTPENINFFKGANNRFIILPVNPTAENYAILLRRCINDILDFSEFNNGECNVFCSGVRYHETATGYAESDIDDYSNFGITDIIFSDAIIEEASNEIKQIINDIYDSEVRDV